MRASTEQDMIVVIAEATTNAPREEGVDSGQGERGGETVGGSREEATLASKSSLITPLSSRLFQLIATRRRLLLSFYTPAACIQSDASILIFNAVNVCESYNF